MHLDLLPPLPLVLLLDQQVELAVLLAPEPDEGKSGLVKMLAFYIYLLLAFDLQAMELPLLLRP